MAVSGESDAIIVGGGIGGLVTALTLTRRGHAVTVLERASAFAEVGAGIQLAPNATRVLKRLHLLEAILDIGFSPRRLVLADAIGQRELTSLDLTDFPERFGGPYVVLHRSDLLQVILDACVEDGVSLVTDAAVVEIVNEADAVRAACEDGRVFSASVLVGADGLRSVVRPLFSQDEPTCSGYVAYRGAVPMDAVERHRDLRDVVAWLGPGLHFVQYPLRAGRLLNQVAVFRSAGYARGERDWGNPAELEEAFAVCCAPVRDAVPLLSTDNRWPMFDREPISTWSHGRIALLGDAAHPMLQYLAQGACQAIQDADALASVLPRDDLRNADSVTAALGDYQALRAGHTARVQRAARTWGDVWHVDGVAKLLRDELLLDRNTADLKHVNWLYGNRVAQPEPA